MSLNSLYVGVIVPAWSLVTVIVAFCYWKRADNAIRWFAVFLATSLCISATGSVLASFGKNNLWLLHIYTAVESVFLFSFLAELIRSPEVKRACRLACIVLPLCCIADILLHSAMKFNTFSRPIEAFFVALAGIYYLSEQIGNEKRSPHESVKFLIVVGLLLYFPASFVQFIFINVLAGSMPKPTRIMVWNIHATLVMLMYIVQLRAMLKLKHAG